jgi:hypothetical protein
MFILVLTPLIGAAIFGYLAYKGSKSGSIEYTKDAYGGSKDAKPSVKNVPIYKMGYFWFAVALVVASIGIAFWIHLEK